MKKQFRAIAILLVALLLWSVTGCSRDSAEETAKPAWNETESTEVYDTAKGSASETWAISLASVRQRRHRGVHAGFTARKHRRSHRDERRTKLGERL